MAQSTLPLSFAPLEGITGWLFRRVHHSRFPGLARYYTPFSAPTADSPLTGRGLNDVLPEHNEGMPVVPQLLTNKADDFISAARRLQDLGYNEVNLNLGCPSGTVVSKKKGAGFLSDPQGIDAFLDTVFRRLDMTVSVKTRIGVSNPDEWPALLETFARYPISLLIIHPRLRTDYDKGLCLRSRPLQRPPLLQRGSEHRVGLPARGRVLSPAFRADGRARPGG